MRVFFPSFSSRSGLRPLLAWTTVACLAIFCLLEIWRPLLFPDPTTILPRFFPVFTGIGRHLKSGQSPFVAEYLFGGHYDLSRDASYTYWNPFYLPATLLADTFARFWMVDLMALLLLLLTTVGFTILAKSASRRIRAETPRRLPRFLHDEFRLQFLYSFQPARAGSFFSATRAPCRGWRWAYSIRNRCVEAFSSRSSRCTSLPAPTPL